MKTRNSAALLLSTDRETEAHLAFDVVFDLLFYLFMCDNKDYKIKKTGVTMNKKRKIERSIS